LTAHETATRLTSNPRSLPGWTSAAGLLSEAKNVLSEEPQLLEIKAEKVLFVGDTHGDLESSLKAYMVSRREDTYLIFLGDYVDRGPEQLENIFFLLSLKILEPDRVFLLRGNHETSLANFYYNFYSAVTGRYGGPAYDFFAEVFAQMPYAAIINGETLALHGGIAKGLNRLGDISILPKGEMNPSGISMQILWNDPREGVKGFAPSPRGPGIYLFGEDVFNRFMSANKLKTMVRGHEYFPQGYRWIFGKRLLTVFSCRWYPGINPAAVLLGPDGVEILSLA